MRKSELGKLGADSHDVCLLVRFAFFFPISDLRPPTSEFDNPEANASGSPDS